MIYHLAPKGTGGIVLANGSLSSNTSNEGEIRKEMVEADLVDCIVMLPKQMFYNTPIPACIWFLNNGKSIDGYRKRKSEMLFIDAVQKGYLEDRVHRVFTDKDIKYIADTYRKWRTEGSDYGDIKGYCKSVTLEDVRKHKYVLAPGRYVGIPDEKDDGVSFEEKMATCTAELKVQMEEGKRLDEDIRKSLESIGFKI